jgi:Predicted RNA polymerase sigma factor containing a TPR repeat domain
MTAALTRIFGTHNLALAEDVVQDAFARALEVWRLQGPPPNPAAWLMATARNRALDVIRRERTARTFAPELARLLDSEWTLSAVVDETFASDVVLGQQLRMMFSCCDPRLPEPAQIALMLNILCGFGAAEIAAAFLDSRAAVEKRIARGKKVLGQSANLFDLSGADFASRLSALHRALYLLFNEGYHGASARHTVRAELCEEAMRLAALLRDHPGTRTPATYALSALMALHAARLPARIDGAGELMSFLEQDRSAWNHELVDAGRALLDESAAGHEVTTYHLEAAIAAMHAVAPTPAATDWTAIIALYDRLMRIAPSPVVALNRAVAVAERDGPDAGIAAIEAIADLERLSSYPFLSAALAEFERRRGNVAAANVRWAGAAGMARSDAERRYFEKRNRGRE